MSFAALVAIFAAAAAPAWSQVPANQFAAQKHASHREPPPAHRTTVTPGATSHASAAPSTSITGATYYVSPSGSDSNSGTSPDQAWRTVFRVDKADLKAGDGVLFEAGAKFSDQPLMPGWGLSVSGTATRPVVFGSYGTGQATLTEGAWIKGERYIVFQNLNVGPHGGVTGTGDHVTVQGCTFRNFFGAEEIPVMPVGSDWVIRNNTIDRMGDSGMLLRGDHFQVYDNVITNTGLDPAITYGSHGIYLKAPDSTVTGNTIVGFRDNGVSVRYRNSVVSSNTISGGRFGIAFFQFDPQAGTSRFVQNKITATLVAGIYVSPRDIAGPTRESFVISGNQLSRPALGVKLPPDTTWLPLSLSPTAGNYAISGNSVL